MLNNPLSFIKDLFLINRLKKDSITGFYLRSYYDHRLKKQIIRDIKRGKKTFCMFGDFNFLKYANTVYGYDAVNKSMKLMCDIISHKVSQLNKRILCIRYGGDEILIIGSYVDKEDIENLKSDILSSMEFLTKKECCGMSIAFGIGVITKELPVYQLVLSRAKEDMKDHKLSMKEEGAKDVEIQEVVEEMFSTIGRMIPSTEYSNFHRRLGEKLNLK